MIDSIEHEDGFDEGDPRVLFLESIAERLATLCERLLTLDLRVRGISVD